ncbi:MAG: N-acetylmuramoyl-L-alanine amidase [Oscillospiraceae bacterium]|nr:N-acetylmuramoyl-L-alanine amidase [Oscillospiraceae bacterium]
MVTNGFLQCHTSNYTSGRAGTIQYIVLHYTANNGDTAQGNCNYFAGANRQASAHFFCDESSIWQSVKETDTAWHCGASNYKHSYCRNYNSIGIEMCSRKDSAGNYYIKPETVENARQLTLALMAQYGIPAERVIRHYDVTGKSCPAPWVTDGAQWTAFLTSLTTTTTTSTEEDEDMTQDTFDPMFNTAMSNYRKGLQDNDSGTWSEAARQWATDNGIIQGSGTTSTGAANYMWEDLMTREQMATVLYRFAQMMGKA